MIQCTDCEFCEIGPGERRLFKCDPFTNIKEPECLLKWQLIRLDMLVASHQGLLKWQAKFGPLQEKLMKFMQREIEDIDESEKWRIDEDQEYDQQDPEANRGYDSDLDDLDDNDNTSLR